MTDRKHREFSDKEVLAARIFCAVVGGLLALVGTRLALGANTSVPPEVAWVAAAIGIVIALFGLLAPRERCVRTASRILDLVT